MLYKLLSHLDGDTYSPTVLSLRSGKGLKRKIEELGIPVYELQLTSLSSWNKFFIHLRKIKPAIIQGWMYHGNLFACILKLLFCPRAKLAFGIRHTPSDVKKNKPLTRLIISLGAFLSKYADYIIYASHHSRTHHEALGYSSPQGMTISNGFDLELFKPSLRNKLALKKLLSLREEDFIIGTAARNHPIKGYDVFLEAAQILKKKGYPHVHFVCLGRDVHWDNNFFINSSEKWGLSKTHLHLLGEKEKVQDLIVGFDVFTLSSYSEGFPNALGEAMSCAVPCVATKTGDCSFIIGETGAIVPPADPHALAEMWEYFIQLSPEKRAEMGKQARTRIKENFSIGKIVEQYATTYASLCNKV